MLKYILGVCSNVVMYMSFCKLVELVKHGSYTYELIEDTLYIEHSFIEVLHKIKF